MSHIMLTYKLELDKQNGIKPSIIQYRESGHEKRLLLTSEKNYEHNRDLQVGISTNKLNGHIFGNRVPLPG